MKMIEVRNPATGLKVGEVRHTEAKDIETAESKARLAQQVWAQRPLAERLEILRRFMTGVKHSGIGRRHGKQGIRRYTQAQSIVSSVSTGGGYDAVLTRLDRPSRVR